MQHWNPWKTSLLPLLPLSIEILPVLAGGGTAVTLKQLSCMSWLGSSWTGCRIQPSITCPWMWSLGCPSACSQMSVCWCGAGEGLKSYSGVLPGWKWKASGIFVFMKEELAPFSSWLFEVLKAHWCALPQKLSCGMHYVPPCLLLTWLNQWWLNWAEMNIMMLLSSILIFQVFLHHLFECFTNPKPPASQGPSGWAISIKSCSSTKFRVIKLFQTNLSLVISIGYKNDLYFLPEAL